MKKSRKSSLKFLQSTVVKALADQVGELALVQARLTRLEHQLLQREIVRDSPSENTDATQLITASTRSKGCPNAVGYVQISFEPELNIRRNPPQTLNRLPRLSDWSVGGRLTEILKELNQPIVIHRKAWEYALCIYGLTTLGVVQPNSRALAIGAGTESPLYYFANNIAEMIATDLYDNPFHEGQPEMLTTPEQFAPFEYRRDHLDVMRMSGDDLQFKDNSFDFVFCLSSIEHFGSRDTQRQSLSEMKRVLRPGGVACIITELILNGGTHNEYFTPAELEQIFLSDSEFGLVGGDFSARIGNELCAMPVDVRDPEDLKASPHIVLTDGTLIWTSASIFLRKRA